MTGKRRVTDTEFEPNITPWNYGDKQNAIDTNQSSDDSSSSNSHEHDGEMINGEFVKSHGMNWFVAALFLVGDMAGGGIVALPTAVQQCGFYTGIIICVVMAIVATASAIFLGKGWEVLPRHWKEYRTHCRKPYAEMGYRALGTKTKTAVSVCLNITQFGICVVFFLLSAKNIHDFIATFTPHGPDLCLMIIIVGLVLLPVTFLKSPEDFWWAIVAGMCSTACAVVLIIIGTMKDHDVCAPKAAEPKFHILNLFTALGTVVFTFGGHSTFPTIQHDMRRPSEFTRSAIAAFITICIFYAPVVVLAHITYGDSLRDSVLNSIQTTWIQQAVNLMIAAHCMLTLTLMFNPLNQEAEELFRVPHEFGIKRIILRSGMMAAVIFVAESVPNFGPVLNLMGASTVTLTCVIFPSVFYLFLKAREEKIMRSQTGVDEGPVSVSEMINMTDKRILIFCSFIIVIGFIGGGAATFSAVREITGTHFETPCYIKPFLHNLRHDNLTSTNCCGPEQNIAVNGNIDVCNEPDLTFYG
ncbi:Amino acid transporter, transmembrane family-containing protein [Aphelenchoides bicaudatus]|nr:Amino acid transporter, transmembrane family-containing protein [Aphelenchoides bicaudatus]